MADEFARPRRTLGRSLTPAAPVERITSTLADVVMFVATASVLAAMVMWVGTLSPGASQTYYSSTYGVRAPWWIGPVVALVLLAVAAGLSGSLAREATDRRSFGLRLNHLFVVDAGQIGSAEAASSPSALRIFLRWALPLAAFVLVSAVTSPAMALLAAVAFWAPALVGSRRSGYDLLLRVAVVKVGWVE